MDEGESTVANLRDALRRHLDNAIVNLSVRRMHHDVKQNVSFDNDALFSLSE